MSFQKRLGFFLWMTRAVIVIETVWKAVLPVLLWALGHIFLLWQGISDLSSFWLCLFQITSYGVGGCLILKAVITYKQPVTHLKGLFSRLEKENRIPLSTFSTVLMDTLPAQASDFQRQVWEKHKNELCRHIDLWRIPRIELKTGSRYYTFCLIVMLLGLLSGIGFYSKINSNAVTLSHLIVPDFSWTARPVLPLEKSIWISPPDYTGLSVIPVSSFKNTLSVPSSSVITISLSGKSLPDTVSILQKGNYIKPISLDTISPTEKFIKITLFEGTQGLKIGDEILNLNVLVDKPPIISVDPDLNPSASGSLTVKATIADEYPVDKGTLEVILADSSAPFELPMMTFPAQAQTYNTVPSILSVQYPFSREAFAGYKVSLQMVVQDRSGQQAKSPPILVEIPKRVFTDPLAERLSIIRDQLLKREITPAQTWAILEPLQQELYAHVSHRLGIPALWGWLRSTLLAERGEEERLYVAVLLWDLASSIEDKGTGTLMDRLQYGSESLLARLETGNPSFEEIAPMLKEMRKTLFDYFSGLQEQQTMDNFSTAFQQDNVMDATEVLAMMDMLEMLIKSGDYEKAKEVMKALQKVLNEVQSAGGQTGQSLTLEEQDILEQFKILEQLIEQEKKVMDETFPFTEQKQRTGVSSIFEEPVLDDKRQPYTTQAQQNLTTGQNQIELALNKMKTVFAENAGKLPDSIPSTVENLQGLSFLTQQYLQQGTQKPTLLDEAYTSQQSVFQGLKDLKQLLSPAIEKMLNNRGKGSMSRMNKDPFGRGMSSGQGQKMQMLQDETSRLKDIYKRLQEQSSDRTLPYPVRDYFRRVLRPLQSGD